MTRFLIASDSFNGTLTSLEAGRTMAEGLRETVPDARTRCIVMADGGHGTIEAMLATSGGDTVEVQVTGPAGTPVTAAYAVLSDGSAVIEMSSACGVALAPEGLGPSRATTRGVGELLLDAARRGCPKITLCLGSSATTDGGAGAASACGVRFLDRYMQPYEPVGATLGGLQAVDASTLDPVFEGVDIQVLCAVENPLCGAMGTSAVLAPTKGAVPAIAAQLDENLAHYAEVVARDLGKDLLNLPCGGAGGGMAAGMAAFFGAKPRLGADVLLDLFDFDRLVADADWVVTGEGRFDAHSLHGRAFTAIARRCKAAGVPLLYVAGTMDEALAQTGAALGVTSFVVLNPSNRPLSQLVKHPRSRLARAVMHVGDLVARGEGLPLIIGPTAV